MSSDGSDSVGAIVLLLFILGMYFLPSITAAGRSHRQAGAIFVLNLLLGWTVIGWVGALVWSLTNPAPPVVVSASAASATAAPTPITTMLRACPHCAEAIQPAARVCRFCQRDVEPVSA